MALMAKLDLSVFQQKAGLQAPTVYAMILDYTPNRLQQTVQINIVNFTTAEDRVLWKSLTEQMKAIQAQQIALQIQRVTAPDLPAAQQIERDLMALQDQYQAAQKTQGEIPAEQAKPETVMPNKWADVQNGNDGVSLAKLYAFLKTLDRFKTAQDAVDPVPA